MQIHIQKLIAGGRGMGRLEDGRPVFVPFSVPGDEVSLRRLRDRGSFCEAEIDEIVQPSADRVEPPCPYFGICGGCQLQHVDYAAQLRAKRKIVIEALERIGKFQLNDAAQVVAETLPSPQVWHYRNRIRLQVDTAGRVGFHRAGSREVVEVESCLIAETSLNAKLRHDRSQIAAGRKSLELRASSSAVGGAEDEFFSQVNTAQNRVLQQFVREAVLATTQPRVIELYAGGGNLTFAYAADAAHVDASDLDAAACVVAQRTAREMKLNHVHFMRSAARDALKKAVSCDVLLLDPPRRGAAECVADILRVNPKRIVYVSCDPATLARDLHALVTEAYTLTSVQPLDMFPHTAHVECIAVMVRT